jgi:hypothetical protein
MKWFSPQISSKPLSPQEMELKKEKEKEKLKKSLQIKGKLTIWEEKDASTSKILFDVILFSPPSSYHFKNPFWNHWYGFARAPKVVSEIGELFYPYLSL